MINQFFSIIKKEFLLLWRDKIGLAVLFVMPMIFLILITWIQFSSSNSSQPHFSLILIDQDHGEIAQAMTSALQSSGRVQLKNETEERGFSLAAAKEELQKGRVQGILIIPADTSVALNAAIKNHLIGRQSSITSPIQLILDPSLPAGLQNIMSASLSEALMTLQLKASNQVLASVLGTPVAAPLKLNEVVHISNLISPQTKILPNPIQQNVPAWAIFGMFFIIVPLGNVLIAERTQSVFQRSLLSPVSMLTLLFGKMSSYVIVNGLQLLLMLSMGKTVLPWLGMPVLEFGPHWFLIIVTGICISLAAVGVGLMLGALFKTEHQLSILAPMLVVIGAAVGGVMLPAYLMPPLIQRLSWLSPLHWGLDAFTNLFARTWINGMIFIDLALLLGLFMITMIVSVILLSSKK